MDRLLGLEPVVPTTLTDVERVTGFRFHEEMHGDREWVSGAFTLADGVKVDRVSLDHRKVSRRSIWLSATAS
jgi:hypothetical protein